MLEDRVLAGLAAVGLVAIGHRLATQDAAVALWVGFHVLLIAALWVGLRVFGWSWQWVEGTVVAVWAAGIIGWVFTTGQV